MAGDSNYANVSLLLDGDGTHGSVAITDKSPSPKIASVFGDAKISTTQSKFGGASLEFDGSGDYLTFPDHADFEFGGGAFTVESWVRLSGYATNNAGYYKAAIVQKDSSGSNVRGWGFSISGTASSYTTLEFIGFSSDTTYIVQSVSFTFALNTWYHVAACRSGNLLYLFVDGVLLNPGGTAFNLTIQNTVTTLRVGAVEFDATFKYYLPGNLDDVRITKGVARYTTNFTLPTRAFPAGAGEVDGIILDDTGVPCARTVRLVDRATGQLISTTISDSVTGVYRLAAPTVNEVQRIILDDSSGVLYNDLIDRVIPV